MIANFVASPFGLCACQDRRVCCHHHERAAWGVWFDRETRGRHGHQLCEPCYRAWVARIQAGTTAGRYQYWQLWEEDPT